MRFMYILCVSCGAQALNLYASRRVFPFRAQKNIKRNQALAGHVHYVDLISQIELIQDGYGHS